MSKKAKNEELAKATRAEKGARLQTKACADRLSALLLLPPEERKLDDLQGEITLFEKRLTALETTQSVLIELTEEACLDTLITDSEKFLVQNTAVLRAAKAVALTYSEKSDSEGACNKVSAQTGARLPKIVIPKFSGDPTKWPSFWDQFTALIDRSSRSPIEKFVYLNSFVTGEAAAVIEGLAMTDINYASAKKLLQERFGRKEKIIFSHIQALLNTSSSTKTENNWSMYDKLQSHIRSLENLGIKGDTYGVILTPLVLHQLPSHFRLEWARTSAGKSCSEHGDLVVSLIMRWSM